MTPSDPRILTLNGGSSSIKFALIEAGARLCRVLEGVIERIGHPEAMLRIREPGPAEEASRPAAAPDYAAAVGVLMEWIEANGEHDAFAGVGHHVVHGGPNYYAPQRVTGAMIEELRRFPDIPQVACFDTAFHHDLPRVDQLLPIPRRYEASGAQLIEHKQYIEKHGQDLPEVRNWKWTNQ